VIGRVRLVGRAWPTRIGRIAVAAASRLGPSLPLEIDRELDVRVFALSRRFSLSARGQT